MKSCGLYVITLTMVTMFLIACCNVSPKKSIVKDVYYNDGCLKYEEFFFDDDSSDVLFVDYYQNGTIRSCGHLDNLGRWNGNCKEFYINGLKKCEGVFSKGFYTFHSPSYDSIFLYIPIEKQHSFIKMAINDTCIAYKNSKIAFFPYVDGLPYGMYKLLFKPSSLNYFIPIEPSNLETIDYYSFETIDMIDTIDVSVLMPDSAYNIIVGESPSVKFTFVVVDSVVARN